MSGSVKLPLIISKGIQNLDAVIIRKILDLIDGTLSFLSSKRISTSVSSL